LGFTEGLVGTDVAAETMSELMELKGNSAWEPDTSDEDDVREKSEDKDGGLIDCVDMFVVFVDVDLVVEEADDIDCEIAILASWKEVEDADELMLFSSCSK